MLLHEFNWKKEVLHASCRIKVLLELFPEARFVHIRRNPYDVFRSTQHWVRTGTSVWALQRPDHGDLEGRTLRQYREVYDVFFEERGLIPGGHFHEIGFEALEADPIGQVRGIYEALALQTSGKRNLPCGGMWSPCPATGRTRSRRFRRACGSGSPGSADVVLKNGVIRCSLVQLRPATHTWKTPSA